MDSSRLAGSLLWTGLPGPELPGPVTSALADLRPAGVILFDRNLRSPGQVRDLAAGVREVAGPGTFVGIDQEGGRVNRLRALDEAFGRLPEARVQSRWPDAGLRAAWARVGCCLRAIGIDVDFAPVVDLDDGDGSNAIGPRSFGTDPGAVTARAEAVLAGLADAGVAGCLKHFPGLGGTDVDTHHAASVSPLDAPALEETHARPFRDLASAAPFVMTSHACYPAVDGPEAPPATFSRTLLHGWLRERYGYRGVVISDDLGMQAVAALGSPGALALRALLAGADQALFCNDPDAPRRARDAIGEALERGRLQARVAEESAGRVRAVRERTGRSATGEFAAARDALLAALDDVAVA